MIIYASTKSAEEPTTRKSYAKPSAEMLRAEMVKSNTPLIEELSEKPLWENDDELAILCGLR